MSRLIAIVEDDFLLALVMTKHLSKQGFICHSFPSANDFFTFEKDHSDLHVVVLDIKLKGDQNGIQLFHRYSEYSKVPVIFSTGNSDLEDLRTLSSEQVLGVLIKPINLDELSLLISTIEN